MHLKKIACGIDEAGRGALAGPIVVACVLFKSYQDIPFDIADSKKVRLKNRLLLYTKIKKVADVGVGIISSNLIDKLGINQATNIAADKSLNKIKYLVNNILIDGNIKVQTKLKVKNIFKGDSNYVSIAAASIIAKVTRDKIMTVYSRNHNYYKWSSNMGYGTKDHLLAIKKYGITNIHRTSYKLKKLDIN